MTRAYSFQAPAQSVRHQTNLYRDEDEGVVTACHISVDPRVVRGSVYSHHKINTDTVQPIRYKPKPIPREQPKEEIQIVEEEEEQEEEPILLDITDRPIEDDIATAAETYIERPPTPHTVKEEPGVDVETQVGEGDLFDFDKEVRPVTIVIVQHTLLRALAEVHEEIELENIRKHRDTYEVERNLILAELQRIEAKTKRAHDEVKRREEQRKQVQEEVRELNREIATRGFAEFYATDVVLHAMDLLEERGMFYDEVEREVSDVFLPWLSKEIAQSLECKSFLQQLKEKTIEKADEIIAQQKAETRQALQENFQQRRDRKRGELRKMLIEDRAGENIRRALHAYDEKKKAEEAAKEAEENHDGEPEDSEA